jgi:hypothetical protein
MSSRRSLRNSADSADGDDAPTPAEILESARKKGPNSDSEAGSSADASTEAAREACATFVDEHLDDERIVSSKQIRAAVGLPESVRSQSIGRTLGCRLAGTTPEGFLDCVELSKWRGAKPVKWHFTRVSDGDPRAPVAEDADETADTDPYPRRKLDLVRAVEDATGIEAAFEPGPEDDHDVRIRLPWMRGALAATIDAVDADVDPDLEVDGLTITECSAVLARVCDTEVSGHPDNWPTATIRGLYDLHVRDCDPSEVEL